MGRELNRRVFSFFLTNALVATTSVAARAWSLSLASDDGSPIRSMPLAADSITVGMSGLQCFGAAAADTVIYELFDYNCGYCRSASRPLEQILIRDHSIALAPLHLPILSPASRDVAVLQQIVANVHGGDRAYGYHLALLDARGPLDRARALEIARTLDLDPANAPAALQAESEAQVSAQTARARSLQLKITPTFLIAGTAFIGWPGEVAIGRFIAAARRCGQLQCG